MVLTAQAVDRVKPLVFVVGLYPLLRWFYLGWYDGFGVNPTEFLTRSSGIWTLVCLIVTLSLSPIKQWLAAPALIRLRRMCGLFAFFYASLHTLAWAWWEQNLVLKDMALDVWQRPFVSVGMAAFLVMLAMALTSSQSAMRRLGRWWKALHRWVYLVAVLSIVHFWLHKTGKNDFYEVTVYGLIVAALLVWRIWNRFKPETKKA
jgi:sulfoxide reductase heme-binding subunit YedZ